MMFAKISVQTRSKVDLVDVTSEVERAVAETGVAEGMGFIFCPHTTAAIVLNENWDPAVEQDVALALEHIVPETLSYRHGEGNSTAHIKSVLVGADHFVFIQESKLQMGTWQGIFLAEFDGPRTRTVWVKVVSDGVSA